jgi:peptide/nickel transport system substrate-binding protein
MSLRYIFHFIQAFIVRFRAIIIIGIFLGIAIFLILNSLVLPLLFHKTERIGITGRFQTDTLPTSILALISDGLVKLDESGKPLPSLASSWEAKDSGKTWVFSIADGKTWQDGKPVTSNTIVYNFSDAKIERPDEKTIIFKLQNPFSPFPDIVSLPTFRKGLLGTGTWKVTSASVVGNYIESLTLTNKSRDRKIIKFYPTEESAQLAYKLGEIDVLNNVVDPKPFANWKGTEVKEEVSDRRFVAAFFNTQDKFLSDKTLRQALNYAINKDIFNAPRALGPVPESSWAYNPQVKQYNYDPTKAKEMITELPKEAKDNLSLQITTIAPLLSTAEAIAKNWEEIGVKTQIQVVSIIPDSYQVLLAILDVSLDPDQYAIWHSTQTASNLSLYKKNARIDKLLEDGRVELNFEERKKIYLDFQRFLVEDSPAAFLYHPIFYTIIRK